MKKSFWRMSLTLVSLLTMGGGASCGSGACRAGKDAGRKVSMEEAAKMMAEEKDYVLLDVRTPEEYESGHIPGAISMPHDTIQETPPAGLPDKNQLILVYCQGGMRCQMAAAKLAQMGYTNIVKCGGIVDWQGEVVKGKA